MAVETKKYLSLDKLTKYDAKIKGYIGTKDAEALQSAKDYADSLAVNYDAAGSAAGALKDAKAYTDTEVAKANAAAAAADAKGAQGVADAAAAQAAADAAQAAADAAQGEVDALEVYVGTIPEGATATDVVGYVIEKTSGIATDAALGELQAKVTQAEKDIDAIEADYLKATDKEELQGAIDVEAERAAGVESGLETRLKAVEDDYLKAVDKTELSNAIALKADKSAFDALKEDVDAFFLDADMTESAKDTLKELQEYIASDESGASQMAASIKKNSDDIDALEERMEAAEDAIDTKAAQSDLEVAVGRIGALETASATHALKSEVESAVDALEAVDAGFETRIAAMEAELGEGEGSVAEQIENAKTAAISEAVAQAEAKDVTRAAAANKYTDDAITALDLDNTYAAKVHGHEMAEVNGLVDALAGKQAVGDYATKTEAQAMADAKDAAIAAAKKAGDDAAAALEAYKTTNDAAVAANKAAIEAFVEISETEINELFA